MRFEHLGARPRIHPDAVIAPTAVISGDVEIGADCQVLHGAVITAEGGPITLGENVIVMENALIRASATNPVHIGDHMLVGPMASVSGATIGDEVFLATGHPRSSTAPASASAAKCGSTRWSTCARCCRRRPSCRSGGSPSAIRCRSFRPSATRRSGRRRGNSTSPATCSALDRDTPDLMVQLTERYGRSLARHDGTCSSTDRPLLAATSQRQRDRTRGSRIRRSTSPVSRRTSSPRSTSSDEPIRLELTHRRRFAHRTRLGDAQGDGAVIPRLASWGQGTRAEPDSAQRRACQPVFCRPAATPLTDSSSRRCCSGSTGAPAAASSRSARSARSCRSESAST